MVIPAKMYQSLSLELPLCFLKTGVKTVVSDRENDLSESATAAGPRVDKSLAMSG